MERPRWTSLEELCRAPIGTATRGRGWAVWCATDTLIGAVVWGSPDEKMAAESTAAFGFACHDGIVTYDAIIDARNLDRIDERALQLMLKFFAGRSKGMAKKARRFVIVRPARDLVGTVVAGILPAAASLAKIELVDDLVAAGRVLAVDTSPFETIAKEAIDADGFLARVRQAIERALPEADIEALAATLGLSRRTLQRRITEENTTYRGEVLAARLRHAAHRLANTDDKITAIALECGFPSSQHFAAAFRAAHGITPTQHRERGRAQEE